MNMILVIGLILSLMFILLIINAATMGMIQPTVSKYNSVGQRSRLSDKQVAQAIFIATDWAPDLKLNELDCSSRQELQPVSVHSLPAVM